MPTRPKKPCTGAGCHELVTNGQCKACSSKRDRQYDEQRGTAADRGYDRRWQEYRRVYLRQHPLCAMCKAKGKVTPATVVDHIDPHRGDEAKFWAESNHQPLCRWHHNSVKQRMEVGSRP